METTKKPKTFAELMNTAEGRRVGRWIHTQLDHLEIVTGRVRYAKDGREVEFEGGIMKFLADNLDEDELPLLSAWSNTDEPEQPPDKDEFVERLELIRNKAKQWRTTLDGAYDEAKKLVDKANAAVDLTAPLQVASTKLAAAGKGYETWAKGIASNLGAKFVLEGNVFHDPECPHRPEVTDRNALSLEKIQALAPPCMPATCCEGLIHKRPEWVRLAPAPKLSLFARIKNWW